MTPGREDRIARLHEVFRAGSSAPACVETEGGEAFVLKFRGAGAGASGLATELIALKIAAALGVRVPPARPVYLPEEFPWQIGTDEFHDMVRRSAGWNLGVALIKSAVALGPNDLTALPNDFLGPLARADATLVNVDRPSHNANILRDGAGGLWAIDFGACLYFNRLLAGAAARPERLAETHFLSGGAHDGGGIGGVPADDVRAIVSGVPQEWFSELPFSRDAFEERLAVYLA